jgi:hypothetical protein
MRPASRSSADDTVQETQAEHDSWQAEMLYVLSINVDSLFGHVESHPNLTIPARRHANFASRVTNDMDCK